jgi:6-phosphogluconate dehydrogenase
MAALEKPRRVLIMVPANLTQAQRDYFGAHTYRRVDCEGTFHTEWKK